MTTTTIKRRLVPLLLAACFGAAVAAPTGQQVVAGQATFSQQGNVFSITNTPGTIINWQSFSINPGEVTRFIQQNADSAVLNRIVGQDPTRILGALQSNGKVFLINPNGILFGRDARVDVNGLVASTLNLSNADFLAGKKNFTAGPAAGEVRNEGAITTPSGGQVFLVAPNVTNTGIITSPKGDVVLAAGHSVHLVDSRDPDMHVVVSAPNDQAINLGQVVAQGGRIGIYGALVNQRGLVSANSAVVGENGKIVLKASRDTLLEQGSVTSATGAGKGGDVHLLGERVGLAGNAQVDASGAQGGGNVLAGGGWQGKDASLANARQTWMGKDASIKADATVQGSGGQVVLWSNDATSAYGSISARGGANGGDGGKVETSGHALDVNGLAVNAGAARGKAGSWLLDPYDIEVVTGGTASVADVAVFSAGASSGVTKIAPSALQASGTSIMLQAQNDLTITNALTSSADVTGYANHDIKVNANVTANGNVLFAAGNAISLNSGATISSPNYVDLIADQMTLAGKIAGISGVNPVITFTAHSPSSQIVVGSGTPTGTGLWLDSAALSRFSAFEVNIGTSANSGGISIDAPLNLGSHLSLDSSGPIAVNAAVKLGPTSNFLATLHGSRGTRLDVAGAVTAGNAVYLTGDGLRISAKITAPTVKLMPHSPDAPIVLGALEEGSLSLTADMMTKINATNLTIGGLTGAFGPLSVAGAFDLSSSPFGKLTLDAGGGPLAFTAPLTMPSGLLTLKSSGVIGQNLNGKISADQVVFKGSNVFLSATDNAIANVAASLPGGSMMLTNAGPLHIATIDGVAGVSVAGSSQIQNKGLLTIDSKIAAQGGDLFLQGDGIAGSGTVKAGLLSIYSTAGVGSAGAPLNTQANALRVSNNQTGSAPVNIHNTGDLMVLAAYQSSASDSGNTGSLTIDGSGKMYMPGMASSPTLTSSGTSPDSGDGRVHTESGNISLSAHDGMIIGGEVSSRSGNIDLKVTSGALEVHDGALVASASGDINVTASSTTIAANTFQAAPGKLHLPSNSGSGTPPVEVPPPTVDQCVANPAAAGCSKVIDDVRKACSADPTAPNCAAVMPKIDECKANPGTTGCEVVIKQDQVAQCVAHPEAASCSGSADYCAAHPTFPGCSVLNDKRGQIDQCIANPKAAGCTAVLPQYDVCKAQPDTYGCTTVVKEHDKVDACTKTPGDPACASVLPPVDLCKTDVSVFGCTAVLDRLKFTTCVANANGPGCDNILPPLDVCKTDKTKEGCGAVIGKAFDQCVANPNDARCVGVLPPISQCVADKTAPGCTAVLPSMNQCIASPTLQGCSVILPKLEQCAANPNQQGCEAVLPKPDFCSSHPGDAQCTIFNPNPVTGSTEKEKSPVAEAVQTTVTLINSSGQGKATGSASGTATPPAPPASGGGSTNSGNAGSDSDKSSDKQSDKQNGPAASENNGAKNEKPATKTYCN